MSGTAIEDFKLPFWNNREATDSLQGSRKMLPDIGKKRTESMMPRNEKTL